MTLFANVYMRYTLRAYVYEAEEKGFTCFDEINKLCTLLKLYLLLFVVKRVADRLVGSMSLLVGEESKQRREHSAEAADSGARGGCNYNVGHGGPLDACVKDSKKAAKAPQLPITNTLGADPASGNPFFCTCTMSHQSPNFGTP